MALLASWKLQIAKRNGDDYKSDERVRRRFGNEKWGGLKDRRSSEKTRG